MSYTKLLRCHHYLLEIDLPCVFFYDRLLEKGFFHRAMKYEKRSERKRKLKESLEKKETMVIDFMCACVSVFLCVQARKMQLL